MILTPTNIIADEYPAELRPLLFGAKIHGDDCTTDKYRQRFIDAYGRNSVDEDMLRVVAAAEVFG